MTAFQLALCALAGAIAAILLLCIGWIGKRIDRQPHCRRCGYDVSGIDPNSSCPECNADLAQRRAIRIGLRRRRGWAFLVAGLILTVASLPGYIAGKDIVKNGVWQTLPDWFVGKLAFSINRSIAEDATTTLMWRDASGVLEPEVKTQVITAVIDAVEKNKELASRQLPLIVLDGMLDGTTNEEEAQRFCAAYFVPKVELVRSGPNPTLRVEFAASSSTPLAFTTPAGAVSYPQSFGWLADINSTLKCPELGIDVPYRFQISPRDQNVFIFNCTANPQSSDLRLTLTRRGVLQFPIQTPGPRKSSAPPLSIVSFDGEPVQVRISETSTPSPN